MSLPDRAGLEYELIIVGAGPAGMEAALAAASAGMQVALVDRQAQPGGQYFRVSHASCTQESSRVKSEAVKLFAGIYQENIDLIPGATVWGIFPGGEGSGWQVQLYGGHAPSCLCAKNLILATGAYDYPVPFLGWTLPGVVTAGAAQILAQAEAILPGERILVAGSGPFLFALAATLMKATLQCDAQVVAVLQAPFSLHRAGRGMALLRGQGSRLKEGLAYARELAFARTPIYVGWGISEVSGGEKVEQAILTRLDSKWQPKPGRKRVIPVDTVVVGYGLLPNNHLGRMLGCRHYFDSHSGVWLPLRDDTFQTSLPGVYIVGDAAEINGAEAARLEGRLAGLAVAHRAGYLTDVHAEGQIVALTHQIDRQHCLGRFMQEVFSPDIHNMNSLLELAGGQTFACRCEEITIAEIRLAIAAGASSPAEIKMMTRSGMGNCQGRICETTINCALVAAGFGRENITPEWKGFSIRPPLEPIPVSVLTQSD